MASSDLIDRQVLLKRIDELMDKCMHHYPTEEEEDKMMHWFEAFEICRKVIKNQ